MSEQQVPAAKDSVTVAIVRLFTTSHLSLLFLLISLLAGAAALMLTPREEDPQIIVPVMDVFVQYPGASAEVVAETVAAPLERALGSIAGVSSIRSSSSQGNTSITLQFDLARDIARSLPPAQRQQIETAIANLSAPPAEESENPTPTQQAPAGRRSRGQAGLGLD